MKWFGRVLTARYSLTGLVIPPPCFYPTPPLAVGLGMVEDDGLSGSGEDRTEPPERRTVLEGLSWRPMGVYSRVPEGQKTNSGFNP